MTPTELAEKHQACALWVIPYRERPSWNEQDHQEAADCIRSIAEECATLREQNTHMAEALRAAAKEGGGCKQVGGYAR